MEPFKQKVNHSKLLTIFRKIPSKYVRRDHNKSECQCVKCPNTEFFLFSRIPNEGKYGPEKNSVFGRFSRSVSKRRYNFATKKQ